MKKETYYGFGYNPGQSENHFYIILPSDAEQPVQVFERFSWGEEDEQVLSDSDILRLEISLHKWKKISAEVASEFNARLKKDKIKMGRFSKGGTPIEKLFGKELMVLLWAIEDIDPSSIPTAIRNWKGLMPEERWWLYTMTNASTGQIGEKRGWRTALRYALCENPVKENKQAGLFDLVDEK